MPWGSNRAERVASVAAGPVQRGAAMQMEMGGIEPTQGIISCQEICRFSVTVLQELPPVQIPGGLSLWLLTKTVHSRGSTCIKGGRLRVATSPVCGGISDTARCYFQSFIFGLQFTT